MTRKRDDSGDEPFRVGEAEPIRETDKALLLNIEGIERWIPKSVIHDDSPLWKAEQKEGGLLVVKTWFARKSGWC